MRGRGIVMTRPAIATEPYSDDAPSSSTSMRSMIDSGIVLRSTDEPTPEAEDSLIQRTPSTSTSTRLEPRWRRSTVAAPAPTPPPSGGKPKLRSEEHTSELQSLMRISYAVFCLKKKKKTHSNL